ncbi:hypothetical protein [Curtobacterium sp. Curtsp57]|uniref:hypothetical protein n=1 Tax=Curtobacterium sp. Curtsp57 TaxID=3243047 RepID=UPI0039B4DD4A
MSHAHRPAVPARRVAPDATRRARDRPPRPRGRPGARPGGRGGRHGTVHAVPGRGRRARPGAPPRGPREEITAALAPGSRRGAALAHAALDFADHRSDSVGESLARVVLHETGAPRPLLQHEFRSPDGLRALVDFWFPDQGVVVEYDGAVKYRDARTRDGRTPEQVVIAEKTHEDWIRALPEVRALRRLTSHDLRSVPFVAATLRAVGVPTTH